MNNIKITIIIPVYNTEKYINQCIDSILCQTYKNIEVVLVDDGSSDKCPKILDEYARKDKRVTVIYNTNGGASTARNTGVKAAKGHYLTFMDSDDYWNDKTALQCLVNQIHEYSSDVLYWGYKKYYEKEMEFKEYPVMLDRNDVLRTAKDDAIYSMMRANSYIACSWNKLVKKELFDKHDLLFVEGTDSEDIDWSARLIIFAESFDILDNSFYTYRQHDKSITKNIKQKNIVNLENNIQTCLNLIPKNSTQKFRESYYSFMANQYANYVICLNYIINENSFEDHLVFAKRNQYLLKFGGSFRIKLITLFNRLIGIKYTIKLLGYLIKIR